MRCIKRLLNLVRGSSYQRSAEMQARIDAAREGYIESMERAFPGFRESEKGRRHSREWKETSE